MKVKGFIVSVLLWCAALPVWSDGQCSIVMDMVHHNPGEPMTDSKFLSPAFLKSEGYNAKVFFLFESAQFGVDWQKMDSTLLTASSESGKWVRRKADTIREKYSKAEQEGLEVYCMLDMLVLPKELTRCHAEELLNEKGKIDINKPFTQACIRELIGEMFETFPQLDGLVVRTGETYLHDAPFHTGNSPIQRGMGDHVTLLRLLREEVCEKRNKKLFYRTWDMGQFHSLPSCYLSVTDSIAPHPNLYFSIKHTMTDFWRSPVDDSVNYNRFSVYFLEESGRYGVPFNPCLGIGKHQQIVEIQCQREYEGKAAYPNYIAKGVIDGFFEFKKEGTKHPYCLNHLKGNRLFKGIWTWSRGGGWGGPYIKNEFWAELNAYVLSHWANAPWVSEEEFFTAFARSKGLAEEDMPLFRKLCLLSEEGVMKGQYSMYGDTYVNWTRDDKIVGEPFLDDYLDRTIRRGQIPRSVEEREEAVRLWKEIERLSKGLHFSSEELSHFVQVTCTYGRIKYELCAAAWKIMLYGKESRERNADIIREEIGHFDRLWKEWVDLAEANPDCPSLYHLSSDFFGRPVGIKETIDTYR